MSRKRNFRTYTITLVAGQEFNLGVSGDMYAVIANANAFTIILDESNRLVNQSSGMGGKFPDEYDRVTIVSATSQSITVIFGYGEFSDARASVNATINTTISPSDTLINSGDVPATLAATQIVAANPSRKEIEICLPSTATNPVRVGNSSVTATSGSIIEPGTSKVYNIESALYVIRTSAPDETITVLELERA